MAQVRPLKLRYDQRALADISGVFDYIAERDPAAASRVVARIREACKTLARHPNLGRKTTWPEIRVRPVVKFPYLVFFTLLPSEVVILHVRHMSRDEPEAGDIGL